MQSVTEQMIQMFCEEYLEKLYYFCLKKTNDSYEAQDLASDIMFHILASLYKGIIPIHFHAWVWQIARNRYSAWAKEKSTRKNKFSTEDIAGLELGVEEDLILEDWIHKENLSLLRRELAFISSDYRNIIVAYYLNGMSVKEIAEKQKLPEGTVKSKLLRARKRLKEGMSMAREFGKMSYQPENVYFTVSGEFGRFGEPWCYLQRLLSKNILLAAYRQPSTAEELAIEIGVALPYMEDELQTLLDATLLHKNGKYYESNLIIVSARTLEKIEAHLYGCIPQLTKGVIEVLETWKRYQEENENKWYEGCCSYEDLKWTLLPLIIGKIKMNSNEGYTIRPNGGEWDVIGMEGWSDDLGIRVGKHGTPIYDSTQEKENIPFWQFKFGEKDIWDGPVFLTYQEASALWAVARKDYAHVSEEYLKHLTQYGYLIKVDNRYEPAIPVILKEGCRLKSDQKSEMKRLVGIVEEIAMRHQLFCQEVIKKEAPDFMREKLHQIQFASQVVERMDGMLLEEALRMGYLSRPKENERRILGAYLEY